MTCIFLPDRLAWDLLSASAPLSCHTAQGAAESYRWQQQPENLVQLISIRAAALAVWNDGALAELPQPEAWPELAVPRLRM